MDKHPKYNFLVYLKTSGDRMRVEIPRWFIIALLSLLSLTRGIIDFGIVFLLLIGMYCIDYLMSKPKAEKNFLEEWNKKQRH